MRIGNPTLGAIGTLSDLGILLPVSINVIDVSSATHPGIEA